MWKFRISFFCIKTMVAVVKLFTNNLQFTICNLQFTITFVARLLYNLILKKSHS